ncbi:MAG TPA: PP2C family protein-serine/threonine phosphatase [Fimbriiglobus sp.]|jgi:sigma-B regulation protein RsbU (phosphoserine phosphatase)
MTPAVDFFDTSTRNWRARLAISVDVMRELSRYTDPEEMYLVFSWRMNQIFPTSRQITISRRGLKKPQYRVTRFNRWVDGANPWKDPHRFPVHSGGIFTDLLYGDEPRVVDNLVISSGDPAYEYLRGQGSLMAVPLFENGTAQNMVVLTRDETSAFPPEQVPELVWMSNLFARAMQTLVLSEALQEANDEAEYELRAIGEIQRSLLPAELPEMPGLDVAVSYRAAGRAGGDYYDFFPVDGERIGVLIADVSGHGTPAAVVMAVAHSLAHTDPDAQAKPATFLARLNDHLARRYTTISGTFVTAFYGVFDPTRRTLNYANAGHVPPRLIRWNGYAEVLSQARHVPLGVIDTAAGYMEETVTVEPGDQVVLLTDGVTEAVSVFGDVFGADRIEPLALAGTTAKDLVTAIVEDVDAFSAGAPPKDDQTVLVVRFPER